MEIKKESEGKRSFIQLIKFGLVGVSNTLVSLIVSNALMIAIRYISGTDTTDVVRTICIIIGYICGIVNSLFLNTRWTFKKEYRKTKAEVIRFFAVNALTCGLNAWLSNTFAEKLFFETSSITLWFCNIIAFIKPATMKDLLSTLLASGIGLIVNFVCTKLFVFTGKDAGESTPGDEDAESPS